jgi:hypothetical protein
MTTTLKTEEITTLTDVQKHVLGEIEHLAEKTFLALNKVRREAEDAMERMGNGQNASYTMDADVTGRSSLDAVEYNAKLLQLINTASMINISTAFIQAAYKGGVASGRGKSYWS